MAYPSKAGLNNNNNNITAVCDTCNSSDNSGVAAGQSFTFSCGGSKASPFPGLHTIFENDVYDSMRSDEGPACTVAKSSVTTAHLSTTPGCPSKDDRALNHDGNSTRDRPSACEVSDDSAHSDKIKGGRPSELLDPRRGGSQQMGSYDGGVRNSVEVALELPGGRAPNSCDSGDNVDGAPLMSCGVGSRHNYSLDGAASASLAAGVVAEGGRAPMKNPSPVSSSCDEGHSARGVLRSQPLLRARLPPRDNVKDSELVAVSTSGDGVQPTHVAKNGGKVSVAVEDSDSDSGDEVTGSMYARHKNSNAGERLGVIWKGKAGARTDHSRPSDSLAYNMAKHHVVPWSVRVRKERIRLCNRALKRGPSHPCHLVIADACGNPYQLKVRRFPGVLARVPRWVDQTRRESFNPSHLGYGPNNFSVESSKFFSSNLFKKFIDLGKDGKLRAIECLNNVDMLGRLRHAEAGDWRDKNLAKLLRRALFFSHTQRHNQYKRPRGALYGSCCGGTEAGAFVPLGAMV